MSFISNHQRLTLKNRTLPENNGRDLRLCRWTTWAFILFGILHFRHNLPAVTIGVVPIGMLLGFLENKSEFDEWVVTMDVNVTVKHCKLTYFLGAETSAVSWEKLLVLAEVIVFVLVKMAFGHDVRNDVSSDVVVHSSENKPTRGLLYRGSWCVVPSSPPHLNEAIPGWLILCFTLRLRYLYEI